jgi:hypothetical protein
VSTTVRPVPALKLGVAPGNWMYDVRRMLDANVDQSVSIPLRHTQQGDDLLIQMRLRSLNPNYTGFSMPNPIRVILGLANMQQPLTLGPQLSVDMGQSGPYHQMSSGSPGGTQWLCWSVGFERGNMFRGVYYSAPNTSMQAVLPSFRWQVIEGIMIAGTFGDYLIAELRLWEGRTPWNAQADRLLEVRRGRR